MTFSFIFGRKKFRQNFASITFFNSMDRYKISYKNLTELKVKTTPQNVKEANEALFTAKWNLPKAAQHCGMSQKEMKLTFWEFLKYNPPSYEP